MAQIPDGLGRGQWSKVPSSPWLPRGLIGFKACCIVAAIAKRRGSGLTAAGEIDGRELVLLILLTLVIEQLGAALYFVGTVFRHANDYISHSFFLVIDSRRILFRWRARPSIGWASTTD